MARAAVLGKLRCDVIAVKRGWCQFEPRNTTVMAFESSACHPHLTGKPEYVLTILHSPTYERKDIRACLRKQQIAVGIVKPV